MHTHHHMLELLDVVECTRSTTCLSFSMQRDLKAEEFRAGSGVASRWGAGLCLGEGALGGRGCVAGSDVVCEGGDGVGLRE
jgi:hypothetical protein